MVARWPKSGVCEDGVISVLPDSDHRGLRVGIRFHTERRSLQIVEVADWGLEGLKANVDGTTVGGNIAVVARMADVVSQ